jgi:amidohydrolase
VIRGGSAENVIPDEVYLEGTLRSYDDEVRETLIAQVEKALQISRVYGGDYRLHIDRGYPVNQNDPQVTNWLQQVGKDLLGEGQVEEEQKSMGAEDFGYMTRAAKGAMFRLGVIPAGAEPRYLHTCTFDLDEEALPVGAAVLAETALRFLRGELT